MTTEKLVQAKWATCVADNLDRWTREPLPRAWRESAPIRQAVRHANSRKWQGLCWAYRVLRETDATRARAMEAWARKHWGRAPEGRSRAYESAASIMMGIW